jgi:hypothetical protein
VEGNIQEALSLTVRPHRSQAPPSSHSLRVSASRQQSFKRLLGGALLPQLPPLLSARRVQRLGLYHLVNPSVGTDLSAVITWVALGLCAAEPDAL